MSETPVLDESVFEKWNSVPKIENFENFSFSDMGPSNVSVRLDLFSEHKMNSGIMELEPDENSKNVDSKISKWNETEQSNSQVVFLNPEWDEIEEEKAGIPSFLNNITPNTTSDKMLSSQVTELVVTDTESVSSVTISLDEFPEDSEEIVAVISDSENEIIRTEFLNEMEDASEVKSSKKNSESFQVKEVDIRNWKEQNDLKYITESNPTANVLFNEKNSCPENLKRQGVEIVEMSKLLKAGCYVMQNGKISKPFYIVKNPILREDIYGNINKSDIVIEKRGCKNLNTTSVNEEEQNLLQLGKNTLSQKENPREPKLVKIGKNQDLIRIIEHPRKGKITEGSIMSDRNNQECVPAKNLTGEPTSFEKNSPSNPVASSCESEDLMWLLDFKLDDLFSESSLPALSQLDDSLEQYTEFPVEIGCQTETVTSRPSKPLNGKLKVGKQHGKADARPESAMSGRTFSDLKYSENRKPPFTYTELIECALQEKGPLTVSEIYNWISETFPYYKSWDDRWKNSVRHNLSINPYFRKGTKARQGSGHLWTVNKPGGNPKINNWKRHRFHDFEEFSKRLKYNGEADKKDKLPESISISKMIEETELATASIEDKENRRLHRDVLMAACADNGFNSSSNMSLEQSAEEILSGVKKNVEVQYMEPVKSPCGNDFLNPISKEILMGECGLLNQIELNLTAETGEHLSIVDGMNDSEHIFGIPDDLNFHYDISSHTPQLLPLAK